MELKPQQFDLSGKEYSYSAYVKAVKTAVTTKIRGKDLQRYLLALLNYTAGTLSKTKIEELTNGKEVIIINEIPYQVNKSTLVEKIAHLVRDKNH